MSKIAEGEFVLFISRIKMKSKFVPINDLSCRSKSKPVSLRALDEVLHTPSVATSVLGIRIYCRISIVASTPIIMFSLNRSPWFPCSYPLPRELNTGPVSLAILVESFSVGGTKSVASRTCNSIQLPFTQPLELIVICEPLLSIHGQRHSFSAFGVMG